jgi:Tfp pilus assembly protein PilN
MIRINLLTEKRAKRIPIGNIIPWFLVLIVAGLLVFGWITGQDFADHYNDQLKADVAEQKDKNERQSSKVKKRDDLKKQLFRIRNDISKLQRLSGANLVQWSQTLNTLTSRVPEKTVWLTNLRIDSDRRVQITAYSCNEEKASKSPNAAEEKLTKGIQEFINVLLNHEYFSDVFLTGATKNLYEKKPVWRFEINCRLAREASSKTSED